MPGLPFGQQNMADANDTLPVILLDDALAVSKAIFAHRVLDTTRCPAPRATGNNRTHAIMDGCVHV